jgi:fatty acid-binding protein DegV
MVHPVTKVRSRRKALATLFQLLDEELAGKEGIHMAVLHVAAPEEAARLAEQLVERFHPVEMLHTECGPVVGTHAGPGTVGVVHYSE